MENGKIINSFAWKMAERIFSQGMNFVVQIVLARILAPEDFAPLAIIIAVTNYANILVQSGLSTALIQKKELEDIDVSTMTTSSIVIAFFLYILIFFAAPFMAKGYAIPSLNNTLRVLALILFFNAINAVQLAILQRRMDFRMIFIRSFFAAVLSGSISIWIALKGGGVWALVSHNLLNVVFLVIIMLFSDVKLGFRFSFDRAKKLYRFSSKILFASLISGLNTSLSTMLIGKKYSKDDLAFYDKANTYSYYIVTVVGYSLSSVMLPVLSRQQDDTIELKNTTRKAVGLSSFFVFPTLLGVAAISQTLIPFILTEKWSGCIPYFMIFCILRLPECIITIEKQAFFAQGKSGICLIYEVMLCILNLIALILSLRVSVICIALSLAAVQLFAYFIIVFMNYKSYGYSIKEQFIDLYKSFFSALIMAAVVYLMNKLLIDGVILVVLQIIAGAGIYFVLSILCKNKNLRYVQSVMGHFLGK